MNESNKGLEHEREHSALIEQVIADAKAGKAKPVDEYLQMLADAHTAKIKDYYDRLEKMEQEAGESSEPEEVEEECEEPESEPETPEEKEERRVSRAYEAIKKKPGKDVSPEADKSVPYTPEK